MRRAKGALQDARPRIWILSQRLDEKVECLNDAMRPLGAVLLGVRQWNVLLPVVMIGQMIRRMSRPKALVYRYLNDHPSRLVTLSLTLSEIVGIVMARLLGIRVIWICHNVDRETAVRWPVLNGFRREILKRWSHSILLTDPKLIPHAARELGVQPRKIDYITFGRPKTKSDPRWRESELARAMLDFIMQARKGTHREVMIGLLIGHASWKTRHEFSGIVPLLDAATQVGTEVRMIVVGPIGRFLEADSPQVLQALLSDGRVFLHDGFASVDERWLAEHVDFWWRVYDDLSVPYGLYHAAAVNKPVLTLNRGFLAEAVRAYGLGVVIDNDFGNIADALLELRMWEKQRAVEFLTTHNWATSASRMLAAIRCLQHEC